MKKNLFLLFSIYFFVVQPLIIWIIRWQTNFFLLWAINLLAIILIGVLYNKVDAIWEENPEHEKKTGPLKETKVTFHEHFHAPIKDHKKRSDLIFPLLISLLLAIAIFFMFQYNDASLEVMLVFALILGFITYLSLVLIFKHRTSKSFWKLLGTKIYLILLIGSIALTAYDYYQVYQDYSVSFQDYIAQNFLWQERIPTDGYIFTGQGTILATGWSETVTSGTLITTGDQEVASDVFSGMIKEATGTVLWVSTSTTSSESSNTDVVSTAIGKQKIMDAIVYLVKKYDLPLATQHDISFTYVSFKNPYYNEWRTAYANKLIWKATNPSKYIVCESYIVMKWLLGKRNVPYNASNVLTKFWAEAVKRNALNGCVKGKIVTDKTL